MVAPIMQHVLVSSLDWQAPIVATLLGDGPTFKRLASGLNIKPSEHILRVYSLTVNGLSLPSSDAYARSAVAAHHRAKVTMQELDSAWMWTTALPFKAAVNNKKGIENALSGPYLKSAVTHGARLGVSEEVLAMSLSEIIDLTEAHFRNVSKLPKDAYELFWTIMEHRKLRQDMTDRRIYSTLHNLLPANFAQLFAP